MATRAAPAACAQRNGPTSRPWTSEPQRHQAYQGFLHYYNFHRPHGALDWATSASTLKDNLPEKHN